MIRRSLILLLALASLTTPAAAQAEGGLGTTTAQQTAVPPQLTYSTLLSLAQAGRVKSVTIDDVGHTATVVLTNGDTRVVVTPSDTSTLSGALTGEGVDVTYTNSSHGGMPPWLALLGLGFIGVVAAAAIFGHRSQKKSLVQVADQAKEAGAGPKPIRFADVAGCDEAIEELRDTLDFLRSPERFEKVGATMPSGLMLYGPPGTGKTLLAKALAGEAGLPFYSASGSDFVQMYVGSGAKAVRELFAKARRSEKGAVIFIDEIDAVGRRRGGQGQPGGNSETENTLNALLVELDGFAGRKGLICVAATNRLDILDPALLRPGRFGMQIAVETPDEAGRRQILDLYAKNKPLADDVDLDALAVYTAGSSGAQLADMLNQAAIIAARNERTLITDADLREGHLRVLAGPERAAQVMRPEEKRLVAWHEAGHVLAAELLETQDKAQRVTIRPRGRAAGMAVYGQTDRALHSRRYLHEKMVSVLAGRAAEQLLVGEISSGAANDLQQANMLARQAVVELGFSDRVGQLIGHEGRHSLSDDTRRVIDEEVERLVADAYSDALRLLSAEREKLDALGEALIEQSVMERVDILTALGGAPPQRQSHPRPAPRRARHLELIDAPAPVAATSTGKLVAFAHWLERRPTFGRRRATI
ncbi:MAG TPA: AAA family ATPase [Gaiellales bacterium]|jgi:cell division protease FtsH|nr:AAA family ATPase [Gaiellales bacterium]